MTADKSAGAAAAVAEIAEVVVGPPHGRPHGSVFASNNRSKLDLLLDSTCCWIRLTRAVADPWCPWPVAALRFLRSTPQPRCSLIALRIQQQVEGWLGALLLDANFPVRARVINWTRQELRRRVEVRQPQLHRRGVVRKFRLAPRVRRRPYASVLHGHWHVPVFFFHFDADMGSDAALAVAEPASTSENDGRARGFAPTLSAPPTRCGIDEPKFDRDRRGEGSMCTPDAAGAGGVRGTRKLLPCDFSRSAAAMGHPESTGPRGTILTAGGAGDQPFAALQASKSMLTSMPKQIDDQPRNLMRRSIYPHGHETTAHTTVCGDDNDAGSTPRNLLSHKSSNINNSTSTCTMRAALRTVTADEERAQAQHPTQVHAAKSTTKNHEDMNTNSGNDKHADKKDSSSTTSSRTPPPLPPPRTGSGASTLRLHE